MCWVPASHDLLHTNKANKKKQGEQLVKKLTKLFNKKISRWDSEAQRVFTALNTFGYGCSDEGSASIISGTLAALFKILKIEISGDQIANAVPSRRTIGRMEIRLAAECLFGLLWEMKEAGVTDVGITTDHGHRKGQDHLVKLLSFPVKKDDGNLSINFLCLNIDSAGHSTAEASDAISKDMKWFLDLLSEFMGKDVKLSVITGDAGGGAAVQHLHPALQDIGIMDAVSKRLSCDLHNLNKALEIGCVDTWGKQGIGHRTPFQMVYLFVKILKIVRKDFGSRDGLNKSWERIITTLRENAKWQTIALDKCKLAFDDFFDKLEELEDGDEDDIYEAIKLANEAPANVKDPTFSRWETVLPALSLFADQWVVIYFFVATVAQKEEPTSYLRILSCELLSLMHNEDVVPKKNNGKVSKEGDTVETIDPQALLKQKHFPTPVFLSVLYFLDGFHKNYFRGKSFTPNTIVDYLPFEIRLS